LLEIKENNPKIINDNYIVEVMQSININENINVEPVEPPTKKRKINSLKSVQPQTSNRFINEFNDYFYKPHHGDIDYALDFWISKREEYPVLFSLAIEYLIIPCTSTYIERVFSKASYLDDQRKNKSDYTFQKFLFVNLNKDLL